MKTKTYAIKRNSTQIDGTVKQLWWTNGSVNAWSEKTPKYYTTLNKARAAIENSYWLQKYVSALIIVEFELTETGGMFYYF